MNTPIITLLLFLSLAVPGNAVIHAQITPREVDRLVAETMKEFEVAGVAVAVVKDGEIVHQQGYGVTSVKTGQPVNEHTNFAIASNSKAFTVAALAMLVEEGKLSWEDRVIDHIPEFKMYNAYVTENFIIRDLLTHRSGLGLGAGDLMLFPDGSDFTIHDILANFKYLQPQSPFRTKFDYDNLLYIVAGEVIARVSGVSWEEFVKTRIMVPLGMDQSYTNLSEISDKSNVARPHLALNDSLIEISPEEFDPKKMNGAAGSIHSNVSDLCHWMIMQLNHGKYGPDLENELFTPENQGEMWKIHTTLNPSRNTRYNSHFAGYGLGWFLTDIRGNMIVSHTGGLSGMLSRTLLVPDLNLGVVVLTNTSPDGGALFSVISQTILDRYLGLDHFDWIRQLSGELEARSGTADSVVTRVWQTVAAVDTSGIHLKDYKGTYEDPWFGRAEVSLKGGQLWFRADRSPKLSGPMAFYKANSFAIKWSYPNMEADAFAIFTLDEEGRATGFRMKGISPAIDFSYDFQDLDFKRSGD